MNLKIPQKSKPKLYFLFFLFNFQDKYISFYFQQIGDDNSIYD